MQPDKIYIIGAGAIGKALAVFLKSAGRDVTLIRGSRYEGARHIDKITVELPYGSTVEADIETATLSDFHKLNGIILFTTKSFGNAHLAKAVCSKVDGSPIVLMQNGLGVEQAFINAGFTAIYRCVLFATSQSLSPMTLRFRPVATSAIGVVKGNPEDAAVIVEQINNPHFQFKAEHPIEPTVWRKTIVNCVFNSVCPLLETDNGIFYRNRDALEIAKRIIEECVGIAKTKGIILNEDAVLQTLLKISQSSEGQLISTYVDILNKRQTEIDSLNFAITGIAEQLRKAELGKETRLLGELIKIKSALSINLEA